MTAETNVRQHRLAYIERNGTYGDSHAKYRYVCACAKNGPWRRDNEYKAQGQAREIALADFVDHKRNREKCSSAT